MKGMVTAYDIFYSVGALWDLDYSFFHWEFKHIHLYSFSRDSPKLSTARFHSVCIGPFSRYLTVVTTWNLLYSKSHRKIDFVEPNTRPIGYYTSLMILVRGSNLRVSKAASFAGAKKISADVIIVCLVHNGATQISNKICHFPHFKFYIYFHKLFKYFKNWSLYKGFNLHFAYLLTIFFYLTIICNRRLRNI